MIVRVILPAINSLTVPGKALIPEGEKNYVFVIDPQTRKVKRVEVTVGKRLKDRVEVVAGLQEGQRIVAEGQIKLKEDSMVEFKAGATK